MKEGFMKRSILAAGLLIAVVPACKTAGPTAPAGPAALPAPLAEYEGEVRILVSGGDERGIELRGGQVPTGACDLAVHVRQVAVDEDRVRFSLDTVGLPKVKGVAASCKGARPGLLLTLRDLVGQDDPDAVRSRVDAVLQTPEAYLSSKGVTFDLPEGDAPTEVASREVFSGSEERSRGRLVRVWPQPLLTVDPWYHTGSDRIHQEGEVELVAVVGGDGRLYDAKVRTGLSASQELAVLRVLPLWRFEPARGEDGAMAARQLLRPLLRVF
jgi:hypothetical protein